MLKYRLSLSANVGRERDNLDGKKAKQTSRWVGAINANFKASEKLMLSINYSNFTMFTSRQLNQFNTINDNPLLVQQPKDSIDYKQIAQNVNLNVNYALSSTKEKIQNINFNYSLSDMVSKENGLVRKGGISRFHNANVNYSLTFPEKKTKCRNIFELYAYLRIGVVLHDLGTECDAIKIIFERRKTENQYWSILQSFGE